MATGGALLARQRVLPLDREGREGQISLLAETAAQRGDDPVVVLVLAAGLNIVFFFWS